MKNKDLLNYLKTLPLEQDIQLHTVCECGYSGLIEDIMCAYSENGITYLCADEDGIEECIYRTRSGHNNFINFVDS
jgi:hypothetical protein